MEANLFQKTKNYARAHPLLFGVNVVGVTIAVASALALPALGVYGLGALGMIGGSLAAAHMSSAGLIQAGSFYAFCQSAAMGGQLWVLSTVLVLVVSPVPLVLLERRS